MKKQPEQRVQLVMACNDPDTGMNNREADMLEFGSALRLYGKAVTCYRRQPGMLQIGKLHVAYSGYQEWVGNWCFDSCAMPLADAAQVLAYVQDRGWAIQEGPDVLCEKYAARERINAADLMLYLLTNQSA